MQTSVLPESSTKAGGVPALALLRCGVCHALTFPANAYGCHRCGAEPESGTVEDVAARGVLRNFVTVHVDLVRGFQAPYVVGDIEFAPGVLEEVLIEVASEADLTPGMAMVGVLRPQAPGGERYPLRFVPETLVKEGDA